MPIFPRSASSGGGSLRETIIRPARQAEPENALRVALTPTIPLVVKEGTSSISQTSSLTSTGAKGASGTSSISQTSSVTSAGGKGDGSSGAISQTSSLTSTGQKSGLGTGSSSSTSSTSSTGAKAGAGSVTVSQSSSVSSDGGKGDAGTGAILSSSSTSSTGTKAAAGSSSLASTTSTTSTGTKDAAGVSSITSSSSVSGDGGEGNAGDGAIVQPSSLTGDGTGRVEPAPSPSWPIGRPGRPFFLTRAELEANRAGAARISQLSAVIGLGDAGRQGAGERLAFGLVVVGVAGGGPGRAGGGRLFVALEEPRGDGIRRDQRIKDDEELLLLELA